MNNCEVDDITIAARRRVFSFILMEGKQLTRSIEYEENSRAERDPELV